MDATVIALNRRGCASVPSRSTTSPIGLAESGSEARMTTFGAATPQWPQ